MHLLEKSYECGKRCPNFQKKIKSVAYFRAMCSPKFQTILIQNGRLIAIFVFSNWNIFFFFLNQMCPGCAALIFYFVQIYSLSQCHVFSQVSEHSNSKWPTYRHFCWLKLTNIWTKKENFQIQMCPEGAVQI